MGVKFGAMVEHGDQAGIVRPSPIRLEYTGNFSVNLRINPGFVDELLELVGEPSRPFVVRKGEVRGHSIDVTRIGLTLSSKFIREKRSEVIKTDEEFRVVVNSAVIDSDVRDEQAYRGKDYDFYESEYKRLLAKIISEGLKNWANGEFNRRMEKVLFPENHELRDKYYRLWRQAEGRIVLFEAAEKA